MEGKKWNLFFSLVLILSGFICRSQVYSLRNFTVDDGLLSSEVYDIVQDQEGYLWIATESGINKYDGYNFQSFTTSNGLPANSIVRLYTDRLDRIWFSTFNGHIGYLLNDSIHIPEFDTELNKYLFSDFINKFYVDSNYNIWMSTYKGSLLKADTGHTLFCVYNTYRDHSSLSPKNNGSIVKAKDFRIRLIGNDFVYSLERNLPGKSHEVSNNTIYLNEVGANGFYFIDCIDIGDERKLVLASGSISLIMDGEVLPLKNITCDAYFTDLYLGRNKYLWVSTGSNGTYLYALSDLNKPLIHILDGHTVGKVIQDHENNYWITTTTGGLYFLPSIDYQVLKSTAGQKIYSMAFLDKHVFYYSHIKGLFSLDMENSYTSRFENYDRYKIIYDLKILDNRYLLTSSYSMLYDTAGNSMSERMRYSGSSIDFSRDSNILRGNIRGFSIYDKNLNCIITRNNFRIGQISTIYEDPSYMLWLGGPQGLHSLKNDVLYNWGDSNALFRERVSCIAGKGSKLFVGTTTKGLIVKTNRKVYNINENNGLLSNRIKCSYFGNNNILWIGTNKGFTRIKIISEEPFEYIVDNFSKDDGLPFYDINKIKEYDSLIYLATEKGIVYFSPDKITKNELPPPLHIEKVIINETIPSQKLGVVLSHDQNNISFYYKAITFRSHDKLYYQFRLINYDQNWITSQNTVARYTSLPHGKYRFLVRVVNNGIISNPVSYSFEIGKSFTETALFYISIVLIIILIISLFIKYLIHYYRKKDEIKRKILLSEQKALRTQMNPHFIFNSLGSIQRYVLKNESQLADGYLTDFAKLMRMILESSKHNFILLDYELRCLQLYLKLENLRFKHFDYTFEIDNKINTTLIKVPPLMIQPYIENAIWHGLMNKEGRGVIKVKISYHSEELLLCEILDNGVGRKKTASLCQQNDEHVSTSMKNIEERISLINKTYTTKMNVKIIDIDDETGTGTIIRLFMYYIN